MFDRIIVADPETTNPQFISLKECDSIFLETNVTVDEIKDAVWECGGDKAPGPDGFTFKFIKQFWLLLLSDIVSYVEEFFNSGIIPKGCNSSFIILIAKNQHP